MRNDQQWLTEAARTLIMRFVRIGLGPGRGPSGNRSATIENDETDFSISAPPPPDRMTYCFSNTPTVLIA
jgi:hypothetical protein